MVSFSDVDYIVREDTGFVPVSIVIEEALTVPFTVTVETQDETAISECSYRLIMLFYM